MTKMTLDMFVLKHVKPCLFRARGEVPCDEVGHVLGPKFYKLVTYLYIVCGHLLGPYFSFKFSNFSLG